MSGDKIMNFEQWNKLTEEEKVIYNIKQDEKNGLYGVGITVFFLFLFAILTSVVYK